MYDKYVVFENNICIETFWQDYLLFEANIFLTLRQFRYKAIKKKYTLLWSSYHSESTTHRFISMQCPQNKTYIQPDSKLQTSFVNIKVQFRVRKCFKVWKREEIAKAINMYFISTRGYVLHRSSLIEQEFPVIYVQEQNVHLYIWFYKLKV